VGITTQSTSLHWWKALPDEAVFRIVLVRVAVLLRRLGAAAVLVFRDLVAAWVEVVVRAVLDIAIALRVIRALPAHPHTALARGIVASAILAGGRVIGASEEQPRNKESDCREPRRRIQGS